MNKPADDPLKVWGSATSRAAGHGVLFDVNGNGYASAMDWVGPRVGIMGIDRDNTGNLGSGNDLLNDMRLAALQEFDTTIGSFLRSRRLASVAFDRSTKTRI
jgi:hypothetical protein